jgi:hypothetical protein
MAVNLGEDADTTGAVFGQLAGAYYGVQAIPAEWQDRIAHRGLIEGLAAKLFDKATSPRGSRKHVLDLTSGVALDRLNGILQTVGARIRNGGPVRPHGYRQPDETSLPDFVRLCRLDQHFTDTLGAWQSTEESSGPTWNLLGMLDVDGRPGLLLVEAKTCAAELNGSSEAVVAAAYLVASCGLDAVLLYLGFTGDDYFPDHFADADAFSATVRSHLSQLIPPEMVGKRVPHKSGGAMYVLVDALPVREVSGRI